MGYESCVLINHDFYGQMKDNPARFVRELWEAINAATNEPASFRGGLAIYWDHSSPVRLLAVGRHQAEVLAMSLDGGAFAKKTQLKLMKEALAKLGYRVVKKHASKKGSHGKKTPVKGDQGPGGRSPRG